MSAIRLQPGTYQTRNSRVVRIIDSVTVSDAPVPGAPPKTREVWNGTLMQMDGKTVDTRGVWEADGRFRNPRGTVTPFDLCLVIKLDPVPPPVVAASATVAPLADPIARDAE